MAALPKYVLITPARNEVQFIELTIKSVVTQTALPERWVIVSDGSTDGTDEIVQRYMGEYPWIELVRMPERKERHFAGKVFAFNAGRERVREIPHEVIACLDADITFDQGYFEFLLGKIALDSKLGLVGTPFRDEGSGETYDYRYASIEHVSGACQVFRREAFDAIGGYVPNEFGCIDHIAVIKCRMHGWKTRTFTEKVSEHHRAMGTAQDSLIAARFKNGKRDYMIGNHLLWELSRTVFQVSRKPFVIGGLSIAAGYLWALATRMSRPVSDELIKFYRREQMQRLKRLCGISSSCGPELDRGAKL